MKSWLRWYLSRWSQQGRRKSWKQGKLIRRTFIHFVLINILWNNYKTLISSTKCNKSNIKKNFWVEYEIYREISIMFLLIERFPLISLMWDIAIMLLVSNQQRTITKSNAITKEKVKNESAVKYKSQPQSSIGQNFVSLSSFTIFLSSSSLDITDIHENR